MKKCGNLAWLASAQIPAGAAAQIVTSGGTTGTVNNIPYASAASGTSTTFSSSPITISGGDTGQG